MTDLHAAVARVRAVKASATAAIQADRLNHYLTAPPGTVDGMSPPQRAFFEDRSPKRFLRKGNKVGGTFGVAAECWAIAQGIHPYIRIPVPNTGLFLVPDLDNSYSDDVCEVFRELEPHDVLDGRCKYDDVSGYSVGQKRGIKLANGSKIRFRSSHQSPKAVEGIKADWIVINEPPAKHVWGGIMRAGSMSAATPYIMLFTVVDDVRRNKFDLGWLREIVEGEDSGWSEHVVALTEANCPHRTPESIAEQIAKCAPWEYDQRILAKWEAPSLGRWLQGWTGTTITDADLPTHDVQIGIGLDHGELPGHEAAVFFAWWTDAKTRLPVVVVFDEYTSQGRTTVEGDALAIQAQLVGHGVRLLDVGRAMGDTNSAGKSKLTSVNREFEIAFGRLLNGAPPFAVDKPRKGPGSVSWGARVLNSAMQTGQLYIHERCQLLVQAVARWKGEDDDHKHLIDALRYGTCEILDPEESVATPSLNIA